MQWKEIRNHYPGQWLLVEAIKAHTEGSQRILDELTVVNTFPDSRAAMHGYTQLHKEAPHRELYVLHTDREKLEYYRAKMAWNSGNAMNITVKDGLPLI